MNIIKIQEQIAFLRKQKGLTQEELAKALGLPIRRLPNGNRDIAAGAQLSPEETKQALEKLPLTVKEEEGELRYRLESSFCHMPALLTFLFKFR